MHIVIVIIIIMLILKLSYTGNIIVTFQIPKVPLNDRLHTATNI